MRDTKTRSTIKAISWRILASITTMILVYLFTGSLEIMAGVGVLEFFIKMVVYFVHERLWNRIKWGKVTIDA